MTFKRQEEGPPTQDIPTNGTEDMLKRRNSKSTGAPDFGQQNDRPPGVRTTANQTWIAFIEEINKQNPRSFSIGLDRKDTLEYNENDAAELFGKKDAAGSKKTQEPESRKVRAMRILPGASQRRLNQC